MPLWADGEAVAPVGPFPPWEAHPAAVHFPIAFLLGAVALDLYAWWKGRTDLARAATWLIAAGTISGLLAVATGLLAFFTVRAHTAAAHAQMYWHLGLNAVALVLFAAVLFFRRRAASPETRVRVAALVAAALLAGGGFLGGRIVYRGGAGVDPAILAPEVRGGHRHLEPEPGDAKPDDPAAPGPKDPHEGH